MMIGSFGKTNRTSAENMGRSTPKPWKSILGLIMILTSLIFNLYWIWGVFFIVWAVNDLINKWTYLLDEVQRSTNPILYWIIVSMWLFFGIWTLIFSPVSFIQTSQIEPSGPQIYLDKKHSKFPVNAKTASRKNDLPESSAHKMKNDVSTTNAKQKTTVQASPLGYIVRNERYGLTIYAPKGWEISWNSEAESETINIVNQENKTHICIIGMVMDQIWQIDEFSTYMQDLLKEDMPYLETKKRKQFSGAKKIALAGAISKLFEYSGDYDGYDVKTLINYILMDKIGLVVIGTYNLSNEPMQKVIQSAVNDILVKNAERKINAK